MKTLADFKRALTLGSRWNAIWYPAIAERERGCPATFLGVREVGSVKSIKVGWKREGKEGLSWLDFPPAARIKFLSDDLVAIYRTEEDSIILTYEQVGHE